jgi:hypothetical protein
MADDPEPASQQPGGGFCIPSGAMSIVLLKQPRGPVQSIAVDVMPS